LGIGEKTVRWIETEETVRFNEVDEWGMAWHGHYVAWFEAGRMNLLKKFDLLPRQLVELGYIAPVVSLKCEFKYPVTTGDRILIRTTVVKPEIAALVFKFEAYLKEDNTKGGNTLIAAGETMQVLLTTQKKMVYRITGELENRVLNVINFCVQD
jgi:acyl-CoA thioester hydrolase